MVANLCLWISFLLLQLNAISAERAKHAENAGKMEEIRAEQVGERRCNIERRDFEDLRDSDLLTKPIVFIRSKVQIVKSSIAHFHLPCVNHPAPS